MGDTQQLDVQEQLAGLYRNQAESDKLPAEENKLRSGERKLRAEEVKLRFEGLKSDRYPQLAPWLAGVSIPAGVVGLIGGIVAVVGLLAPAAGQAG